MKYHKSLGITHTLIIAVILATTVAIGPLNLLQIGNAIAQQPATSNPPSPTNSPSSQQGSGMMQANNSMNQNPKNLSSSGNQASNLTGSISIFSPIVNAFKSAIHVNLNDAITTAQEATGNNATTLAAFIHPYKGFIVYEVFTLDSSNNIHRVIVDPGNGKVLSSEQMSIIQMMMMVHSGVMAPDMMMNHGMGMGPGMDNGMMMNKP